MISLSGRRRAAVTDASKAMQKSRPLAVATFQLADPLWRGKLPDYRRRLGQAARAALKTSNGAVRTTVTVVLADDALVQSLNSSYRGKDKTTNVLSFSLLQELEGERLLGDVVLARQTVAREAKEQGKSFAAHATHLVVHGVLHLMGYDHERPKAAKEMEALERTILADLGLADPYLLAAKKPRSAA